MAPALTLWDDAALLLIVGGILVIMRRGVPKAYGLGFLMMLVYALELAANVWGKTSVSSHLAFRADEVLAGERLWSPLSSMFVHAGWGHIIGNLFILLTAGPALEDRVGERKFMIIFFTAGFAALVAHVILTGIIPSVVMPESLALGASGAIFGVLTAFAVRYPFEKLPLVMYIIFWVPAFAVLLLYLAFNLYYMFTETNIAWWGHFAGFLVGLPFAYSLPKHATGASGPAPGSRAAARGLPDADKLAPFATSAETRTILERIRQFTPETRTKDDAQYVDAWLDRFFAKATCPQGHAFTRDGLSARCSGGETRVDFARPRKP